MSMEIGFLLLLLVSMLAAVGHICFKKAAVANISFARKFVHPFFLAGVFFFICCPVISSLAAQVIDFSIMYAMTALNFVFVLLLSRIILEESIDWPKITGVCIIVIGLLVMITA
ncbi:hypothetical protein JWG39_09455 [Desulforhopalus vacuolatus]|uniref:hypothetical protein n=1 Tax=Desulforhopalus vacuolatus TaxID=40414 RepID=UPI0019659FE5|nr:hypothetical protein [Desulforhopalus vacuolatus]MBM9520039.1 hypothetical protein [Desulforhopalus vacuolatus]